MTSPINDFQDILNAIERDPALRDALRRHILTEELLQVPVRLERIEEDITSLKKGQDRLEEKFDTMSGDIETLKDTVARIGGDVSRLTGTDYESHVATYVHRFLRRSLGINASTFSTQRDKSALAALLDEAEAHGIIDAQETDDLNLADLVLTSDGPTDYILAEVSITIQQDDIDRAAERARLLTKATARTVTPFAIGVREQPDLRREHVQVIRSDSALGAFLRRKKAHLGAPKAITATAHKLARIIYSMLRYGQGYVDAGAQYYESQYQERALRTAKQRAAQLGYQLVPLSEALASPVPHAPVVASA